ncbi:MAG: hypothetical protein COV59_00190 [Candidatus Magasanikbacteria bacterium CG11_big_fil_rev_8_21_14_0_20_39_34]|uniref:Uncharacterized protein n=1 Tax=Candidatus Magasanikbacteria bacterium CG11_big_fil_rev_8_21_14_0_20_39_34 TaxID=1974653 RepID=A0A2H0N6L0_9BACT|nr:MAG: hypothetical protein COV59_00190 [Candidatus Magasanikbacteria bacterium CG11_big_fil_rev_8_21_14_0_20_39_34]
MPRYETLFIEQQLAKGVKKDKIKEELLERGFLDEKEIDDALEIIQEKLNYHSGGVDDNFVLKSNIHNMYHVRGGEKFFRNIIFICVLALIIYLGAHLW